MVGLGWDPVGEPGWAIAGTASKSMIMIMTGRARPLALLKRARGACPGFLCGKLSIPMLNLSLNRMMIPPTQIADRLGMKEDSPAFIPGSCVCYRSSCRRIYSFF